MTLSLVPFDRKDTLQLYNDWAHFQTSWYKYNGAQAHWSINEQLICTVLIDQTGDCWITLWTDAMSIQGLRSRNCLDPNLIQVLQSRSALELIGTGFSWTNIANTTGNNIITVGIKINIGCILIDSCCPGLAMLHSGEVDLENWWCQKHHQTDWEDWTDWSVYCG